MAKKEKQLETVTPKVNNDAKQKALDAALKNIEKTFGKGAVMRLGDENVKLDVDVISTSSIGIDMALGIGGIPKGRIIEIYGPESSGKTTLALHVIAEAQKKGGIAATGTPHPKTCIKGMLISRTSQLISIPFLLFFISGNSQSIPQLIPFRRFSRLRRAGSAPSHRCADAL